MSRLLSVGASALTAVFVILFVIGAATWVNPALADEPLLGCEGGGCEHYSPANECKDNEKVVECAGSTCDCMVVVEQGVGVGCTCESNGGAEPTEPGGQ